MTTEKITTVPKHSKQTYSYAASLAWQKLSYYGWRSILFLLLYNEYDESNLSDFGYLTLWISISLSASYLLGGIIGDLWLGNRKTTVIGGILMSIGSLLFFFNPTMYPYAPIAVFVIGCGLYHSNLKALYAKLYLHDLRLIDSAFILLNLFIIISSFFGAFLVGYIAETYGIEYGFLSVGISTLISISMIYLTKSEGTLNESNSENKSLFNKNQIKPIGQVLLFFAVYCFLWRLTYYDIYSTYWTIDFETTYLFGHYWIDGLSFLFYMVIGIYLVVLWSRKYYDQLTKLTYTTIITFASFIIAFSFYNEASITTSILTMITLFTYTVGDLLIEPLINSSIARLVNQRYLAIGYGTIGLLAMGIGYLFSFMEKGMQFITEETIYVGFAGLFLLGSVLLYIKYSKK